MPLRSAVGDGLARGRGQQDAGNDDFGGGPARSGLRGGGDHRTGHRPARGGGGSLSAEAAQRCSRRRTSWSGDRKRRCRPVRSCGEAPGLSLSAAASGEQSGALDVDVGQGEGSRDVCGRVLVPVGCLGAHPRTDVETVEFLDFADRRSSDTGSSLRRFIDHTSATARWRPSMRLVRAHRAARPPERWTGFSRWAGRTRAGRVGATNFRQAGAERPAPGRRSRPSAGSR